MPSVELQPLSLGEVLDRTFALYRNRFWLFVGIMAVPEVFLVGLGIFAGSLTQRFLRFPTPGGSPPAPPAALAMVGASGLLVGAIGFLVVYFGIYSFALGATTLAVSRVYLGRAATIRDAYADLRGRVGRLLVVVLAVFLRVFGAWLLASFGAGLGVAAGALAVRQNAAVAVILVLVASLAVIGSIVLVVWLALRYSLCIPALLVEDLGAGQAIRRSVGLSAGYRGRIFLLALLMLILTYAAVLLFQGPFFVVIMAGYRGGDVPLWLRTCSSISGGVGAMLTGPLMMIGLSLFYYDIRVKKEALDLQLMLQGITAGTDNAVAVTPATPAS